MALQFVLGPSGVGKSHMVYEKMIADAMAHPKQNYILLVPEQYSLALQRKMVKLHPHGGTMNIDVIGFNRLAYRIFDEQNIKVGHVLEDFGKTMLIRQVAEQVKDSLTVYGSCLDKPGFIDEVKSLMSEMYQYDISRNQLEEVLTKLQDDGSEQLLYNKLHDMKLIFAAFEEHIEESYIVAEQLMEILEQAIPKSALIQNSTIVFDGFTGFTPIQRKVIRVLMSCAKETSVILTIDEKSYYASKLPEHDLFYLSKQTIDYLRKDADMCHVATLEPIFVNAHERSRFEDAALAHLEHNLFRYPYTVYSEEQDAIAITAYDNPLQEITGIATEIHKLVKEKKYRYQDIAIISGDLERTIGYVERVFPMYGLPYFLDYSRPIQNNPCIDALEHLLTLCQDGFSYDSMFAFLKSGVFEEITYDEIEMFENYALEKGMHGFSWWSKEIDNPDIENVRQAVMEIVTPFSEKISGDNITVSTYVEAVYTLFESLSYEDKLSGIKGLYPRICEILDKMLEIMANDVVAIDTFTELLMLGLSDLTLGMIPNSLDSVIVGDITRTRLDDIRVLFVVGVNDGVIPKNGTPAQIISDHEKDRLENYAFTLAPTEKVNAYIEQFYLYINMTKPKNKLYLSYTQMSGANEPMRPSYVIGRIEKLFGKLKACSSMNTNYVSTKEASVQVLIAGLQAILQGDNSLLEPTLALYKLYLDSEDTEIVSRVESAILYNNIPTPLSEEVAKLVRVRLLSQSVSGLEKYANCAYSYFLQYTLGIRERGVKQIDNRNVGIIMHAALESLYRHVHDNMNNDWQAISDTDRDAMMERFVKEAFASEYEDQLAEDVRYQKLQETLVRIGKRTVNRLVKLSDADVLKPEYFEYRFLNELPLDTVDETMLLRGVVDRGDVYYDEAQKKIRLRIVDYKSSGHDFKINELYDGLQLQLAVYMSVMEQLVQDQYKKQGMDKVEIEPDGMFYYQMKDPYVEAVDETDAEKKRDKALVLKGLKQADAEYFHNVISFANKKMKDLASSMLEGKISKEPMVKGNRSACTYCAYADVCRFDEKCGNNHFRYPTYKESERDLVYDQMLKEMGGVSSWDGQKNNN